MILQWYYSCQGLIDDGITMVLQLPGMDWQWYYNVITIVIEMYYKVPENNQNRYHKSLWYYTLGL